jgi:hypothetical protein
MRLVLFAIRKAARIGLRGSHGAPFEALAGWLTSTETRSMIRSLGAVAQGEVN